MRAEPDALARAYLRRASAIPEHAGHQERQAARDGRSPELADGMHACVEEKRRLALSLTRFETSNKPVTKMLLTDNSTRKNFFVMRLHHRLLCLFCLGISSPTL